MRMQEYNREELRFAYCYHVYTRWRTHRRRLYPALSHLNAAVLQNLVEPYGIRVLEAGSDGCQVRVLASLRPEESISGCASKMKGQVSKWLKTALRLENPETLLARGYFVCTSGKSTGAQVGFWTITEPSPAQGRGIQERKHLSVLETNRTIPGSRSGD
jgi:REP element-mobilizing transposase RayT